VSLEQISTVMQDMMMTTLIVSAPMLIAALVVGLGDLGLSSGHADQRADALLRPEDRGRLRRLRGALSLDDAAHDGVQRTGHGHRRRAGGTVTVELALMPVLSALLGSVRVLAMMWVGPLFSHPAIGARVRVMAALMVAWVAAPVGVGRLAGPQWDLASVAAAVAVELLVGLAVGVGAMLVFSAMMLLGELLAVQGGLGALRRSTRPPGARVRRSAWPSNPSRY
jgi:type III secretory pathway component EscT